MSLANLDAYFLERKLLRALDFLEIRKCSSFLQIFLLLEKKIFWKNNYTQKMQRILILWGFGFFCILFEKKFDITCILQPVWSIVQRNYEKGKQIPLLPFLPNPQQESFGICNKPVHSCQKCNFRVRRSSLRIRLTFRRTITFWNQLGKNFGDFCRKIIKMVVKTGFYKFKRSFLCFLKKFLFMNECQLIIKGFG